MSSRLLLIPNNTNTSNNIIINHKTYTEIRPVIKIDQSNISEVLYTDPCSLFFRSFSNFIHKFFDFF